LATEADWFYMPSRKQVFCEMTQHQCIM